MKNGFEAGLRKSFLQYAVIPLVVAMGAIGTSIVFYNVHSITQSNRNDGALVEKALARTTIPYMTSLQNIESLHDFLSVMDSRGKAAVSRALYDFLLPQEVHGRFYILTDDLTPEIVSNTNIPPYLQTSGLSPASGFINRMKANPGKVVVMPNTNHHMASSDRLVLSLGRLSATRDGGMKYVVFELPLAQTIRNVANSAMNELVVVDNNNDAAYCSNDTYIDQLGRLKADFAKTGTTTRVNSSTYAISAIRSEAIGLIVFTITNLDQMLKGIHAILVIFAVVIAMLSAVLWWLAIPLARLNAAPLEALIRDVKHMQADGVEKPINPNANDEFQYLENTYNSLLEQVRLLVIQNRDEVMKTGEAQIKALESQFDPHFIFNTLEIIRCLIHLNLAQANQVLLAFSETLRYSMNRTERQTEVKRDFCYLERYLFINKQRYEDKLEYDISLLSEAEDVLIPKLLVQPLVENAIKYGIGIRNAMHIRISAIVEDGALRIDVMDDGPGIPPETMRAILQNLRQGNGASAHFGILSVHRRVALMYGEPFGLRLDSERGVGTRISVLLPCQRRVKSDG